MRNFLQRLKDLASVCASLRRFEGFFRPKSQAKARTPNLTLRPLGYGAQPSGCSRSSGTTEDRVNAGLQPHPPQRIHPYRLSTTEFGWSPAFTRSPFPHGGIRLAGLSLLTPTALAAEGLRPIRGPIVPGFWEQNAQWAIPALVLGLVAVLALALLIRKSLRRPKPKSPLALYREETEEVRTLLEQNEHAEVPARLSRVLRQYIEGATGVRAPEQTTEEFLAMAGQAPADPGKRAADSSALEGGEAPASAASAKPPAEEGAASARPPTGDGAASARPPTGDGAASARPPTGDAYGKGESGLGETTRRTLPPEAVDELRPFLALADEAKFARRSLGGEECRELLARADRFVAANEERMSAR